MASAVNRRYWLTWTQSLVTKCDHLNLDFISFERRWQESIPIFTELAPHCKKCLVGDVS